MLQAATGPHVESLEISDIGSKCLTRDTDDQNRLFVRNNSGPGDDAFRRHSCSDVQRPPRVADRAGNITGRKGIAKNSAVTRADNRGGWITLDVLDACHVFACEKIGGNTELGGAGIPD